MVVSLGVVTGLLMAAQPANEGAGRLAHPADWPPRPVTTAAATRVPALPEPTAVEARRPRSGPRVVTVSARGHRLREAFAREAVQAP